MAREISDMDDVIDSREIMDRIAELSEQDSRDDDETAELTKLETLAADGGESSEDWQYGATLIRDSYFKDYAQDLAEDIGAIDHNATWPMSCIDWDQAARELQMDYRSVDFDGITYWVR